MQNPGQIQGIIPPVATPMRPDEELDLPRLRWFLDRLIAGGVHGVFVLGTNSEFYALDEREKQAVVATAVGGLPSVVPESVGKLVPYGDLDGLTRAYRSFVNDRARTATMGNAARRLALADFSLEAMTDRYEALYNG